jgi:hypothetical protein
MAELRKLSDADFLAALRQLEPLPDVDDDDSAWDHFPPFDRGEWLVAFSEQLAERQLVAAIPLVFERASLGSAYGMMLSIRHGPERAVGSNDQALTDLMVPLVGHARAGARRWSIAELGTLRDISALQALLAAAASDPHPLVREEACASLGMLSQVADGDARNLIHAALQERVHGDAVETVRNAARDALASTFLR